MAIVTNVSSSANQLVDKEINAGARGLILDNLQVYQYRYPFKSSIRELVSNSLDAIGERENALAILSGTLKVEDVYLQVETNELTESSKFDPSYYNPEWLSNDSAVYVTYYRQTDKERDRIVIEDFGVGLRPEDRLPGYLQIGYSTKRLSFAQIGKYGIGAKAPLSTQVPFFTVHNYYNGWEYGLNVYSAAYENIIPERRIEGDEIKKNDLYILRSGEKTVPVYRKRTNRKNGLIVEFAVKSTNYQKVLEAVKTQLMYYPQIVFRTIVTKDNQQISTETHETAADVILRTPAFLVCAQNYYNAPHAVIGRMNYGLLNFDELEIERKQGALGVIIDQTKVDIGPSREELVYSDRTCEALRERLETVKTAAEEVIAEELKFTELISWLNAARATMSFSFAERSRVGKVLSALKHMVDPELLSPIVDWPGIGKYTIREIMSLIDIREISVTQEYVKNKAETHVTRDFCTTDMVKERTYFLRERFNAHKDDYLFKKHNTRFHVVSLTVEKVDVPALDENTPARCYYSGKNAAERERLERIWSSGKGTEERMIALADSLNKMLSETLQLYEDIEVPKNSKQSEQKIVDKSLAKEEAEKARKEAIEQAKKERQEMLKHGDVLNIYLLDRQNPTGGRAMHVSILKEINHSEIYYGDSTDIEALRIAKQIDDSVKEPDLCDIEPDKNLHITASETQLYKQYEKTTDEFVIRALLHGNRKMWLAVDGHTSSCFIFRVPKKHMRHMRGLKHINEFFPHVKNSKIVMADKLVKWNTARLIEKEFQSKGIDIQNELLSNFPELCKRHSICESYILANNKLPSSHIVNEELETLLSRLAILQEFIADNPDETQIIAEMVKQLAIEEEAGVKGVMAVDLDMLKMAKEIASTLQDVPLLRYVTNTEGQHFYDALQDYFALKNFKDL